MEQYEQQLLAAKADLEDKCVRYLSGKLLADYPDRLLESAYKDDGIPELTLRILSVDKQSGVDIIIRVSANYKTFETEKEQG